MFLRALVALSYLIPCFCKVYEDVTHLPGLSYDFVIVGGGTAGNVVANRLTENPNFSVLVLEAGVSFERRLLVSYKPTTMLIRALSPYPGRMQRTQSALNLVDGMAYTRGSADDYNRYAKVTGDPGWSWDRLLPYFFKAKHVIQTTKELPEEFPFNLDMNSGKPLGFGMRDKLLKAQNGLTETGWIQSTIGGGERSTSATSYLAPKYIQRENLDVLLHAQVSRLVYSSRVKGKLAFGGVEFAQGGSLFTAKARKEIILSAGAVGTPAILMHSGIGDRTTLDDLGIPSLLDLKSVGRNASDQPIFGVSWSVNSTQTLSSITQNQTRFNEAFAQWNRSHTGPFSAGGTTHLGFLRLDAESLGNFTDPSAGPDSPHIEIAFTPGGGIGGTTPGNFMSIGMTVLNPVSRGSVTITSNNPFDPPAIDPAFLQNELDLLTTREALKRVQRFVSAPVWRDYIIAPTQDLDNISQDELNDFIRNSSTTTFHLVGTAAMSAKNANYGVVDPDLLVKGATGLRVIDASVLPFLPTAHTQAATYVVAERAADLVKEAWGFPI
ncbi:aryl-alcohol-oxidase from pleurotus Eryingii [Mycena latifolia]|nr:aryl-alcohol-oxidase from pleurotus Eryingii [Mycena latifolia]